MISGHSPCGLAACGIVSHILRTSSSPPSMCWAPTMHGPLYLRPLFIIVFYLASIIESVVESVLPRFLPMSVTIVASVMNLLLPQVASRCNRLPP